MEYLGIVLQYPFLIRVVSVLIIEVIFAFKFTQTCFCFFLKVNTMYRQTVANSQWELYHNRSATDQTVLACQMLKGDTNIRGQNTDCFTNHNGIYIYILHHSSSVCNIYITNQQNSNSCTHKQLTCMPFSSSFS